MLDLTFDTETTGVYVKGLGFGHPQQPHIVQLGLVLSERAVPERIHHRIQLLIDPGPDVTIAPKAQEVHGISIEHVRAYGVTKLMALSVFVRFANLATRIVGHNLDFDLPVVLGDLLRIKSQIDWLLAKPMVCTMLSGAPVLKLPGRVPGQPKWPSLEECVKHFYPAETWDRKEHNALEDALVCHRVFSVMVSAKVPLLTPTGSWRPMAEGEENTTLDYGWLDEIIQLSPQRPLDGFEKKFLGDFAERREKYGDSITISDKQRPILRRIGAKCGVTVP